MNGFLSIGLSISITMAWDVIYINGLHKKQLGIILLTISLIKSICGSNVQVSYSCCQKWYWNPDRLRLSKLIRYSKTYLWICSIKSLSYLFGYYFYIDVQSFQWEVLISNSLLCFHMDTSSYHHYHVLPELLHGYCLPKKSRQKPTLNLMTKESLEEKNSMKCHDSY